MFFAIFGQFVFSFEGQSDRQLDSMLTGLSDAVISDRKSMLLWDSLRSLALVLATVGILWASLKQKITYSKSIIALSLLVLLDLIPVALKYVNTTNFVEPIQVEKPFIASEVDKEIRKDKSHYRVLNFVGNPMSESRTSYFHNSVGGYHAAKPRRYQELFDFQIAKSMNDETLNMLNTKYIIFTNKQGKEIFQENEDANGNAWFVNNIHLVNAANEEIKMLDKMNTKTDAVIHKSFENNGIITSTVDSTATIKLTKMETTKFTYQSHTEKPQFAVFSEMYFKDWVAYIDGIKAPISRVNYVLRGLSIPKGKYEIIFDYQPKVIRKGNRITIASYVLFLLIGLGWFFIGKRK